MRVAFAPGKEGDAAATAALTEEAALYGTKPGDTKPGVAPGSKAKEPANPSDASTNPYHENFRGNRDAAISKLVRGNPALAVSLARSCNKTLTGQPLAVLGKRFVDPKAALR
jgi:hypothetical protein